MNMNMSVCIHRRPSGCTVFLFITLDFKFFELERTAVETAIICRFIWQLTEYGAFRQRRQLLRFKIEN